MEGFEGDGIICTGMKQAFIEDTTYTVNVLCLVSDIPECERGLDDCDLNATCTNTFGGYNCSCNTGFTGDGFNCTGMCTLDTAFLLSIDGNNV